MKPPFKKGTSNNRYALFYANRAFRKAMAAAYHDRLRAGETGNFMVDSAWRDMQKAITASKFTKIKVDPITEWKVDHSTAIIQAFKEAYAYLDCSIKVGKGTPASANRTGQVGRTGKPKYHYDLQVGWLWRSKVYEPLLKDGKLFDKEWIVLAAEELRINERMLQFYEATAFHIPTLQLVQAYIAQNRFGERKAYIKNNQADAIKLAMRAVEKTINKEIIGEQKP